MNKGTGGAPRGTACQARSSGGSARGGSEGSAPTAPGDCGAAVRALWGERGAMPEGPMRRGHPDAGSDARSSGGRRVPPHGDGGEQAGSGEGPRGHRELPREHRVPLAPRCCPAPPLQLPLGLSPDPNSPGLLNRSKWSQNPRTVWVERDCKDHPVPATCHGQGHLPLD